MVEELALVDRIAILEAQRRDVRVQLEQIKNQAELAKFLDDKERMDVIRKDAEKVMRAIEFFDKKIQELKK